MRSADESCRTWLSEKHEEINLHADVAAENIWVELLAEEVAPWNPKAAYLVAFVDTGLDFAWPQYVVFPTEAADSDDKAAFLEMLRAKFEIADPESYWGDEYCYCPADD